MRNITLSLVAACILLTAFPSAIANTSAHPHGHSYIGTAMTSAYVEWNVDSDSPVMFQQNGHVATGVTVAGACADVFPIVAIGIPLEDIRDDDAETSYGGTCFSFRTLHGDDTGASPVIYVADALVREVVYLACVDVNADGACIENTGDHIDLCWTGVHSNAGSLSLKNAGASCTVYQDPAALDKTLYIFILGSLVGEVGNGTPQVDASAGVRGSIYLF